MPAGGHRTGRGAPPLWGPWGPGGRRGRGAQLAARVDREEGRGPSPGRALWLPRIPLASYKEEAGAGTYRGQESKRPWVKLEAEDGGDADAGPPRRTGSGPPGSLDAAALEMFCARSGTTSPAELWSTIARAHATVAADTNELAVPGPPRHAFVGIAGSEDVLGGFAKEALAVLPEGASLPPMSPVGDLDLRRAVANPQPGGPPGRLLLCLDISRVVYDTAGQLPWPPLYGQTLNPPHDLGIGNQGRRRMRPSDRVLPEMLRQAERHSQRVSGLPADLHAALIASGFDASLCGEPCIIPPQLEGFLPCLRPRR